MNTPKRWILTVVTSLLAIPAGYAAGELLSEPAPDIGRIAAVATALAAIP